MRVLVKEPPSDVSPSDYTDFDMEVAASQSPIDVESIAWQQDSRQEAIILIMDSKSQENKDPMRIVGDYESEEIIYPMTIKSV